jgi:hypothetical protein
MLNRWVYMKKCNMITRNVVYVDLYNYN